MQHHDPGRDLDTFLAAYTAVDPRPGLEQRVLANLAAKRRLTAARNLWRRPVLVALAVAVTIAVASVSWLSTRQAFHSATKLNPASRELPANDFRPARSAQSDAGMARSGERRLPKSVRSAQQKKASTTPLGGNDRPSATASDEVAPKLVRFPAPEPLSEQEKLLVRFVEFDPQAAVLVAEERAEQLRREDEEIKKLGGEVEKLQQER